MASASESETDVTLFVRKTLHAVLSSRIPRLRPDPRPSADRCFLLDLGDLPAPIEYHGTFSDPLVVDILITPRGEDAEPGACETVVERWTGQYVPWNASVPYQPRYGSFQPLSYSSSVILLRSIFALLRLLPAHRIFLLLCSGQRCNYDLGYRVSSFAAPFSRVEEANLKRYSFAPVGTLSGQLTVSVQYRPSLFGFNVVSSSHTPPIIIADYIGSPAVDPIRTFPASLPDWASLPNTSQHSSRVIRPLAAVTPQCDRPHSWNTAPMSHHPLNPTQGRIGELGPSPSEHYFRPMPNRRQISDIKGNFNFDDIRVSLPSPSPATLGGHCLQSMEKAPMSIPSDTIKSLLAPLSPRSARPSQEPPSKSTSLRTSEGKSAGDIYSNLHMHAVNKGLKDGRADSRRFSALPYGGSPRYGSSRSSRQFSMQDDPDNTDFSYPFAVNNDDTSDSQTRSSDVKETESSSSHKSQQASVGILVHMLKTAPPLRQDQSYAPQSSHLTGEVSLSSSILTRKTSDALEELQSYKHMKNLLLSKSEATAKLQDSLKQKEQ